MEKLEANAGARECYVALFEYIRKYHEFYKLYLDESGSTGVLGVAGELLKERFDTLKIDTFDEATRTRIEYHGTFMLFGMTAIVRAWLARDCRETPEELYEILRMQTDTPREMVEW